MSFKDCIDTAQTVGRISAERAARAHKAFDTAFDEAIAEGLDEASAVASAAQRATEQITDLNAKKRWVRLNEMQVMHKLHQRLSVSKDPFESMTGLLRDLDNTQESVSGILMANLDRLMEKYKPKMGGFVQPVRNLDDIVYARYGDVRSPEAKNFADALADAEEQSRTWANSLGASIPENPNRRMPQSIVERKIASVSSGKFVEDFIDALDWSVVRYAGKEVKPENRVEVLESIYDGIISEGHSRRTSGQANAPGLVERLNRERFFYYNTADDWLRLQKLYGEGNVYEQVINGIDVMAKDISLMTVLGPNPDVGREFAKRENLHRASVLDKSRPANKQKFLDQAKRGNQVFEEGYEIHSRHVPSIEGNVPMQTFAAVRQTAVNALLGGVAIPTAFGDFANSKSAGLIAKLPEHRVLRGYIENFVPTKSNIEDFVSDGIIYQNAVSLIHQKQRYFGPMEGPNIVRRIGDITYRATLASHLTQVSRVVAGQRMLRMFAKFRHLDLDEVPFAAYMVELGITKKDWDRFRVTPVLNRDGGVFLRPIDMYKAGDREIALKFQNVMQDFSRMSVVSPDLRSRVAAGEAIDPNSAKGQFMRSSVSLLSFPIAIHFNQLKRIWQAPNLRDKITLSANYAIWTMMAGMAITQAKTLTQSGQNFYNMDPTQESFWTDFMPRSMINAGTLGLLGDVVMNNLGVGDRPISRGTPVEEYLKKAANLVTPKRVSEGKTGVDALRFLDANIPDPWYAKLVINRVFMDELLRIADPAAYARKKQYELEHEEGSWWGQGENPTMPDLSTAVGG